MTSRQQPLLPSFIWDGVVALGTNVTTIMTDFWGVKERRSTCKSSVYRENQKSNPNISLQEVKKEPIDGQGVGGYILTLQAAFPAH